jgi:glycosyltransferase involved in cell wall biosynthesis
MKPALHFGLILSSLDRLPGGLETLARGLARSLARRGHRVTTVAGGGLREKLHSEPGIEALGVPCPSFKGPLWRPFERIRPGWTLALQSGTFVLACRTTPSVYRRILECPVTVTFLEKETVAVSQWRARLARPNISYFPGVVHWRDVHKDRSVLRLAASRALAANYRNAPELPIHGVLYPGIEPEALAARGPAVRADVSRVLFIGRLEANKGISTLLQIARDLATVNATRIELRLAGDGPMRSEVVRASEALGGAVRLICLGSLSPAEIRVELERADLFVFPSRYESFGIAVLEALAAGVPVVCSDLPALREVAGEAAVFVSPSDTRAWVEATTRLVHDRGSRERLSELGRERAQHFTWDASAECLEAHAYAILEGDGDRA